MGHIDNDPGWTDTAATPVDAVNLENMESVLDDSHPFAGLRPDKLHMATLQRASAAQNVETVLLNIGGPGVVRSIWMAIPGTPSLDGRLRIYYDGEATPSVDIDCGTLFAMHYGAGAQSGAHNTQHLSAQMNSSNYYAGYLFQFPVPFGSSIKIAFYNPNASVTGQFYSMVTYHLYAIDRAGGKRFRIAGARLADQTVAITAAQTYTLANITGAGWLVGHSYVGGWGATTNLSWLERDIAIAVDGETTPAISASGTEDWFDSAWYYNGWRDFDSSINSYVGTDAPAGNPYVVAMTTDFWSKWGGVPFTTSCVVTLLTEAACTTGHSFSYAIMYYG